MTAKKCTKSVMHVQSFCFVNLKLLLSVVLFDVAVVVAQVPYCCSERQ